MNNNKKYVCIHGHFYQPPRENAWLEMIEVQKSAAPFHDWNERITHECYAPNAQAPIWDASGEIIKVVNNYSHISFNFGPTLLSWMEKAQPAAYRSIISADKLAQDYFNGHGSAIAQVYNHIIMPLANAQDKHTQVIWGIRDFEYRFGRKPKGMWLAETAVDTDTLEVLANHGIEFTILAPRQAKAVRTSEHEDWIKLDHAAVDPRRPYKCKLKDGRSITLFFYDGNVSQGVAFSGLLHDGKGFAKSIINTFSDDDSVQLAHIGTDGESYGHHHKKGEMALADCLDFIATTPSVSLCNYASFMEAHPAVWEVEIHEKSSWSCVHGVERWRSNCGCHSGGHEGWTQSWRKPLRETLDWLRDELVSVFEQQTVLFINDPWAARNDYIGIILDRSMENWQQFMDQHCSRSLTGSEQNKLRVLMEMQRQTMYMFTSCGWFFDEVSGLETNQILQYAKRAIGYAEEFTDKDLNTVFLQKLTQIPSNVYGTAAKSYEKYVASSFVSLEALARYFAVSLFYRKPVERKDKFYFNVNNKVIERRRNGDQHLLIGCMEIQSKITLAKEEFCYAILQKKDQLAGQINLQMGLKDYEKMREKLIRAFSKEQAMEAFISKCFGKSNFGFNDLLLDQQEELKKVWGGNKYES